MNRLGAWVMGLTLLAGAGVWSVNRTESDWVLRRIDEPAELRFTVAHPVTVAVVDTGILPQAALDGRRQSGYDFAAGSAHTPHLINPHGTAVAGVVHSVNPGAKILDVRLSDTAGQTTLRKAIDALRWAAGLEVAGVQSNPFPARVINASFTLKSVPHTGCAPTMQSAVNEILAHGTVIVVAAGNTNAPAWQNTPGGCRGVITVAATDDQDHRAPYSDWGAAVALSAPGGTVAEGVDVWWGKHLSERRGSSYAAPLVAGAASLLLAQHPELNPAEVRGILQRSARPFAQGGCDPQHRAGCGAGVLDVAAALRSTELPPVLAGTY
ncbi:S8 family serine peptidase [Deinococcus sp. AJ005]|uniref:S8 family serine peptidase n=1 Tax=Deinococcus sp. AJ005 TaxID=2652443 RepID=UPI00125CCD18|nr:S8 family serine peptidase [Deinococcus sp. AJ005]QFP76078.1 S8 family serine peptidase [Deinococcus sp. AJ005]